MQTRQQLQQVAKRAFLIFVVCHCGIFVEPQPTLEEAMQNIFTACDTENQGAVPTAKLIEYISPFMAYNRCVFANIKL